MVPPACPCLRRSYSQRWSGWLAGAQPPDRRRRDAGDGGPAAPAGARLARASARRARSGRVPAAACDRIGPGACIVWGTAYTAGRAAPAWQGGDRLADARAPRRGRRAVREPRVRSCPALSHYPRTIRPRRPRRSSPNRKPASGAAWPVAPLARRGPGAQIRSARRRRQLFGCPGSPVTIVRGAAGTVNLYVLVLWS
jgi:hypothetical protein